VDAEGRLSVSFGGAGGTAQVIVRATDPSGAFVEDTFAVTTGVASFRVIEAHTTPSGVDIRFNRDVDLTKLNLFDGQDMALEPADLSLTDGQGNLIRGSAVWDETTKTLRFVASGGPLAAGQYTRR
jgi:hypothetical protein